MVKFSHENFTLRHQEQHKCIFYELWKLLISGDKNVINPICKETELSLT